MISAAGIPSSVGGPSDLGVTLKSMSESSFQGRPGGQYPRRNLTEGPIAKTLILFSLPMLGTNVLQSLNLTANQFWVSHLLGVTAIAAIGNANVIGFLAQGAIFGATMAANILIAQAVGAADFRLVKRVMGTAISFFFVLSVLLALLGWNFAPHVLTLMRTPPAARPTRSSTAHRLRRDAVHVLLHVPADGPAGRWRFANSVLFHGPGGCP